MLTWIFKLVKDLFFIFLMRHQLGSTVVLWQVPKQMASYTSMFVYINWKNWIWWSIFIFNFFFNVILSHVHVIDFYHLIYFYNLCIKHDIFFGPLLKLVFVIEFQSCASEHNYELLWVAKAYSSRTCLNW